MFYLASIACQSIYLSLSLASVSMLSTRILMDLLGICKDEQISRCNVEQQWIPASALSYPLMRFD